MKNMHPKGFIKHWRKIKVMDIGYIIKVMAHYLLFFAFCFLADERAMFLEK